MNRRYVVPVMIGVALLAFLRIGRRRDFQPPDDTQGGPSAAHSVLHERRLHRELVRFDGTL
jgi:hypothetical protein